MTSTYWTAQSARIIRETIADHKDLPIRQLQAVIGKAYPFGARRGEPYRIWREETAKALKTIIGASPEPIAPTRVKDATGAVRDFGAYGCQPSDLEPGAFYVNPKGARRKLLTIDHQTSVVSYCNPDTDSKPRRCEIATFLLWIGVRGNRQERWKAPNMEALAPSARHIIERNLAAWRTA